MKASNKYWQMLDSHPPYVTALADLIGWSHNFDFPTPFNLFLDLIGFSVEHYGEYYCVSVPNLGYEELSKLGLALDEYSMRPWDVNNWLEDLLKAVNEDGNSETN